MSVGLFIPLPANLAEKFPSLGDHDTSPPHATLLYFGDAPEDTERFLDVLRAHLQQWPREITATLRGLRHFDNPDGTVAYNGVRFDADVAGLRASLIAHLSDNGFPSTDRSPTYYYPHVTLAYLPPNSVGEYRGPVPDGSWTFDEVEVWGLGDDPVALPLGGASTSRVAARYKSKKKIETKDGGEATVYEYGPRQVANRHREKAERVEHLRNHISDLRERVSSDLKSDDPMTRLTALAVSLMDHTCERVGNDDSAKNGHYGVTGWKIEHVTFRGDTVTIEYVGKSGVDHTKTVDHGPTVKALREVCKDRDGGDAIFDTGDAKVSADDVNDYLAEFDVTAKDIRGYRANDEMCKALREERSKGPKDLPRSRKEKDKILKDEFKRALETVAETVGHEAATLRSQYLVPGLEDQYVHDGTVIKSLKTATKTDAEREDEATEKLVKPSPKKKPPRKDLRNERVESEDDPDLDTDDDDLSLNFKKVATSLFAEMAVRVAARYLDAKRDRPSRKERKKEKMKQREEEEDEFLADVEGRKFVNPDTGNEVGFKSLPREEQKKIRAKWRAKREKEKDDDSPEVTIEDSTDEEAKKLEEEYSEGEKPEGEKKPEKKPEDDEEGKRLTEEYEAEKSLTKSELDEAKADEAEAQKAKDEADASAKKEKEKAKAYKAPPSDELLNEVTKDLTTKAKLTDAAAKSTERLIGDTVENQNEAAVEDFKQQSREQAQGILDRAAAGGPKALAIPDGVFPKDAKLGKTYNAEKVESFLEKSRDARDKLHEKAGEAQGDLAKVTEDISENAGKIREHRATIREKAAELRGADKGIADAQKAHTKAEEALKAAISPVRDPKELKSARDAKDRAQSSYDSAVERITSKDPKVKEAEAELDEAEKSLQTAEPEASEEAKAKRDEALKKFEDARETAISNASDDAREEIDLAKKELDEADTALTNARNPKRDPKAVEEAKANALEALKKLDGLKADKAEAQKAKTKAEKDLTEATERSAKLEEAKTKAEETVKGLEADLAAKNTELNRQTAYAIGMTHYMATQTDPTVGASDPATRRTESAKKYDNLTPEAREEGLGRSNDEVKRLKEEVEDATGEAREALQKELAVAEAENQAARFSNIVNGEEDRDDDIATKLIRKFGKERGIDDPHIQTLLEIGTRGPEGRKAFYNLASKLSDDDLTELVGDMGGPSADTLKSLGGFAGKGAREAILKMTALNLSGGVATESELDELESASEGLFEGVRSSLARAKSSGARKKLVEGAKGMASWIKSSTESLPAKLSEQRDRFLSKLDQMAFIIKPYIPQTSSPSTARVAARFLSYPTTGK
jgi:2'-5' RNA ligase